MQSKKGSLIEAAVNTFIGYTITLVLSPLVYHIAGVQMSVAKLNLVVLMFTAISVIRSYIIRRFFNRVIIKTIKKYE